MKKRRDVKAEFAQFHATNPQVYKFFNHFTHDAIARGFRRFSAHAIIMRIRWETALNYEGREFKIRNEFFPFYARLWMLEHPEYAGFFRTTKSIADEMFSEAA